MSDRDVSYQLRGVAAGVFRTSDVRDVAEPGEARTFGGAKMGIAESRLRRAK